MRLGVFSEIEVGEIDDFALDFTQDMGLSTQIDSISFTCALLPGIGYDPDPQSRISNPNVLTQWSQPSLLTGELETLSGYFAAVTVGPLPASAAGGTYVIEAIAMIGARQIQNNGTVRCVATGC